MRLTSLLLLLTCALPVFAGDWSPMTAGLPAVAAPPPAGVPVGPPFSEETPFECRPEIIAAFQKAWALGGSGREEYEAAFRVDRAPDGWAIEFMPMTREAFQLPVQYYPKKTIAIVHTHPDAVEPTPGPGDYAAKVPNYVLSRRALYVTVPGTRKHRRLRSQWSKPC